MRAWRFLGPLWHSRMPVRVSGVHKLLSHAHYGGHRPYVWQRISKKATALALPRQSKQTSDAIPATVDETNLILGRALNMTTSSTLRVTIIDSTGNVKLVNGEFKRSTLLSEFGLLPRDLRKIDVSNDNIVPTLIARENSILITLLHIRALIRADTVVLFETNAEGVGKSQSVFLYDLEHKLKNKSSGLPYEQRALEAILTSVLSTLDTELKVQAQLVKGTLADLEKGIDRDKLRHLLVSSKQLSAFSQKVTLIRDALEDVIDDDEELADLHLTAKAEGRPLKDTDDHSDLEIMLESYYNYSEEIAQTVANLASNIKSTEEVINIVLDSNRNTLMLLELKFQIGMMALSGGSVIAALYGMNLKNFIEDAWWGFGAVTFVIGMTSLMMMTYSLRHLRQVQKMHMGATEVAKRRLRMGGKAGRAPHPKFPGRGSDSGTGSATF